MSRGEMTPPEFELYVRDWISANVQVDKSQVMEVSRLGTIEGPSGTYKIDVLVRIEILNGAQIIILSECKHLKRPVERGELQVLLAKIHEVGAHKGMIFSTSGFQAGAIKYAKIHGIAAVNVSIDEPAQFDPDENVPQPAPRITYAAPRASDSEPRPKSDIEDLLEG